MIWPAARENASLAELEAAMKKHFKRLAPVLDLKALIAPADGIANRDEPQAGTGNDAWGPQSLAEMLSRQISFIIR